MKLLMMLLRSSWLGGLSSAVLGAVSGLASLSLITLIHSALSQPQVGSYAAAGLFSVLCLLVLVTQVASKCLLVRLSQSTSARLRLELCKRIISAPLERLEAVGRHRLLTTLVGDVTSIVQALSGLPSVCAKAMVLAAGIGYLATLSPLLAICTVAVATLGVMSYLAGNRLANRYLSQAREDQDELFKQLRSMIQGIKELQGNRRRQDEFVNQVLLNAETSMRKNTVTGQSIHGFAQSWGRLMVFIGIGLLLFVSPQLQTVDAATLTGFTLTILYLTFPLDGIVGWLPALSRATIALNKIDSLGLLIKADHPPQNAVALPAFEEIELRNVVYQYGAADCDGFSLGPLDLTVESQEVLFIAGGNGSGKTTLVKLLTGLYSPTAGSIALNGVAINEKDRIGYRQLFSTIFVEGNLFDRLLGIETEPGEIANWCSLLGISSKVDLETGQLVTDELSRGQHKRIALLVACLDDSPIFVFDEWAAEQEPDFKDVFYRQILPELKRRGRTVVAITHDDRYFFAADRVLTLLNGRITSVEGRKAA